MRILYINHYAGSPRHGMEYRPFYLAREWVRAGHEVQVIASSFSHIRAHQPEIDGARRLEENIDGIAYEWLAGTKYSSNGVRRVWSILVFLWHLYRDGRRLANEFHPDVVIASSTYPMDIWPARRIARITGAKLIYEVHDLWPLSPMELGGVSRWHPFILWAQAAENYAYRHADCVVSLLPNVSEHMAAHGLDLRKLAIVPNGVDPNEWRAGASGLSETMARQLSLIREKFGAIVGYAGTHGVANALDRMLDCAVHLQGRGIAFVLVGDGPDKPKLVAESQRRGLENMYFFDPIPKFAVPALLKWFDVAFLSWNPSPLYRFGISPNKLFDYMMAARPVVQCIDAPPGPVEASGCGACVASSEPRAVGDAIERILALTPEERQRMGQKGHDYVLAKHTYPVLAARFLDAVKGMTCE